MFVSEPKSKYIINESERIKVIDSRPGAGKTSFAIQYINKLNKDTKTIYITPFLSEVDRIIKECPDKKFVAPKSEKNKYTKRQNLFSLINKGENIVSTHALFSNINEKIIDALRANEYILFLDEVFQTVDKYELVEGRLSSVSKDDLTRKDVDALLNNDLIEIADDFSISWKENKKYLSKYDSLIDLADRNLLYLVDGFLLLWTFPIEVFRAGVFEEIFIMTYQFESQFQYYYYRYFDLQYSKYVVKLNNSNNEYYITKSDFDETETKWKDFIKNKIHILDDSKMNKIGDIYLDSRNHLRDSALSKTWYSDIDKDEFVNKLKNNLENYFKNITKSGTNQRLWTSFKEDVRRLKSKNVSSKYWLACTSRATNDYGDRTVLAYMINRFVDPFYIRFFDKKGIVIDQEKYALSELIQWIFRSAIRNDKDIYLYIPAERMRRLLIQWLNEMPIHF